MPTFTMELWRVIEQTDGDIGLNEYPIFDAAYRPTLNKLITDHYHNREIGMETVGMFVFAMKRRMNEIMPYYNDLYRSQRLEFDPLSTIDIRTITSGESFSESEASSSNTSTSENRSGSRAVQSNTPQVNLSGNGDYASNAADTTSTTNAAAEGADTAETEGRETTAGESHVTGYQGSPSALIQAYRQSLMNVDLLVIDDLSDLFMGVWDNGDDFLPYPYTRLPEL